MPSAMDVDGAPDSGVEEMKGESTTVSSADASATAAAAETSHQKGKGEGDRNVMLHPLTVIAISDHHTRVSMGGGAQEAGGRVIGLLFGSQNGLDVSIFDAMEVACTKTQDDGMELIEDFIEKQKDLYTAVYPMYEILGWYTVGKEATEADIRIQRQMMKFNQAPLFLLMNPKPAQGSKELPVLIHESEAHILDGRSKLIFVQLAFQATLSEKLRLHLADGISRLIVLNARRECWKRVLPCSHQMISAESVEVGGASASGAPRTTEKLETTQAEQISVEHVAKATPTEGKSSIDLHAGAVGTSLKTLLARIQILRRFLQETKDGNVPIDFPLLRQISSICNQLPTMDGGQFFGEFMREYNDSLAVTYLASVQKSTSSLNDLADKFNIAFGDRQRRVL